MSVFSLKKSTVQILFALLLLFVQNIHAEEKQEVRIGVLAVWGSELTSKMWQPTINYLNNTIPNYHFILAALKLSETTHSVSQRELDFIITNPGNYIDLEARFGISRLATLKTKKQNKTASQFSAVIFTRNDRTDINSLEDMHNKSFMGVKKKAFGGFQMAWLEFKKHNINPFKDFSSLQFSGLPQDKIVYAVLNNKVDAGTVRTTTLERMAAEGLIDINEIKILNPNKNSELPFVHSTSLYPEWPIAKLKDTPHDLAKRLSVALLKLPENSLAAKSSRSSGWTVPLDYSPVRELFKELNLPPYRVNLPSFFERYWLHSLLFLMLFLQPLLIYVYKLKKDLRIDEEKIAQSETEWSNALDFLDEPMYMVDLNDRIIRANKAFYKKIKTNKENAIGKIVTDFTHPECAKKPCKVCEARKSLTNSVLILEEDDPINKSGKPLEISVKVIRNNKNKPIGIIQKMRDLSGLRKAEKELKRLATFPENDPNPIIEFTKDGVVTYSNPAAKQWFPNIDDVNNKHEILSNLENEYSTLKEGRELARNIEVGGSTFEQKVTYNLDTDLFRTYIWDITKLRNLTQKMTYQATHDGLTNLINRREFERRLELVLAEAKYNKRSHSLCYMDLDQFKAVNDSCGHAAGDELLKQLSARINLIIREADTFARLGGDEFGLLLIGCPIEKASVIAEEIRKSVEDFRFLWENKTFKIGISIGIVKVNEQSGLIKELLSAADTACYIAKEQGRNRVHIYETDSKAIAKHTNETNWLNRINNALDNNAFVLYFQRIAPLKANNYEHYEVLVRMLNKDGSTIPPNSFIPAAERFDIMSSVDRWVIGNTLSIMKNKEYNGINFSINLSGQSLSDLKFMQDCLYLINHSKVDPRRLCFEITETTMIENLSNAIDSISTLRGLGCKISLDDFGSGLSSFAYLKSLPVDYLKIDGSLIKDIENDPVNVTMVKSIIHIGQSMGLETIAEYVENDAILNILRDLDIDYVQGYGVAQPVPIEEINSRENNLLEKNKAML